MPLKDICANCKWFRATQGDRGNCVRFPPQVFVTGPGQITTTFPVLRVEQSCGEFTVRLFKPNEIPAEFYEAPKQ